jgi:hypothetical protein
MRNFFCYPWRAVSTTSGVTMTFKAITFSFVAAAALLAQPAFAQSNTAPVSTLSTATVGGIAAPAVGFGLVAVTTLVASKKDTSTATSTATATN